MAARQRNGAPAVMAAYARLAALVLGALAAAAGFAALGQWQLERRLWKLDLIARVDARLHAAAVAAPGPSEWAQLGAARDEYRRVHVTGRYLYERETLVQAATVLGSGWWVLTPLRRADASIVLVNRGYVVAGWREAAPRGGMPAPAEVAVSGLLRLTEPDGGFLRRNDPAAGRWYSRDVAAIARAQGLERVAPYFIDAVADAPPAGADPAAGPVGGLTVTTFPNHHLEYALTWYALALLAAAAPVQLVRIERRSRRSMAGAQRP